MVKKRIPLGNKAQIMEKILDALSASIDHPKKAEVIAKLKEEFAAGKRGREVDRLMVQGTPEAKMAVDQARVVLFNRLREGAEVEDAIRVSLQPHFVGLVQPHVAKQVEDRIVQTYRQVLTALLLLGMKNRILNRFEGL